MTVQSNDTWIHGFFSVGIGLFLFFRGFKALRIKRQIAALATSKIRSMAMGLIELYGRVQNAESLLDPIYSKPCAYFNIKVQELRRSGKNSHWVTIYEKDSATTPFLLSDETGMVLVNPVGAELERPLTLQFQNGFTFGASPDLAAQEFLKGFQSFLRTLKLEAHILRQGDPLFLLGYTQPQGAPQKKWLVSLKEAAEKIKTSLGLMKSLDSNRDGQVDSVEWDKGVRDVRDEMEKQRFREETEKGNPAPTQPINIVTKSPNGLFIFGEKESDVLSRFGWQAFFFTWGGPALVILGLWLILRPFF